MTYELLIGDCVDWMADMDESSVDAIVCDPPYGLSFMGKAWDNLGKGAEQHWHEQWAREALRVLKPGGHLLSFGGTRTYHRLAAGIEDAGFEIRDSISWMYGSGFPKSHDISKAIDKAAGARRKGVVKKGFSNKGKFLGVESWVDGQPSGGDVRFNFKPEYETGDPATPDAEQWRGWGTALKPASETIIVAQKPHREADIIRESLCQLEAQLTSLAKIAGGNSSSKRVAREKDMCVSAGWTVAERRSTRAALCEAMGTSRFASARRISLSIVSSWKNILDELCELTSMYTIETKSDTTIALSTLESSLSDLTPLSIIKAVNRTSGSKSPVLPVASVFSAVEVRLTAIRELLVREPATSQSPTRFPGEVGPSSEPIVVARKPLIGTVAKNVIEHGTGALNIDATRIGTSQRPKIVNSGKADPRGGGYGGKFGSSSDGTTREGRWPANVMLSHSEDCVQVGTRRVKGSRIDKVYKGDAKLGYSGGGSPGRPARGIGDEDGCEQVEQWACVPGCPVRMLDEQTAGVAGRSAGAYNKGARKQGSKAGAASIPIDGLTSATYSDKGGVSRFFYSAKSGKAERNAGLFDYFGNDAVKNHHPTVKPINVMRWLVRLVTPPGGVVLDPFMGSGTTGCAAMLEGFDFIGIEQNAGYAQIAEARIRHYES